MKKIFIFALVFIMLLYLPACSITFTPVSQTPSPTVSSVPADETLAPPEETVTPEPEVSPLQSAPPTPQFGEEPDHAGSAEMLFDIYQHTALVDMNLDGTPEQLTFTAGGGSSQLQINDEVYTIERDNQAQLFAVTDVDVSDSILELAFTDEYSDDLADTEFAFTYLYWWNGTELIRMGGLMDMKFAGAWRSAFDPAEHFDAHGTVMCLTRTEHFSDAWYTGHYMPNGANRKLKEDNYAAPVLFNQEPLTLKHYIILLKNIDTTLFDFAYEVCWDYASGSGGYGFESRDFSDDYVSFIPQAGEELTIIKVYGKKWFKLKAADGKQGWLKCEDGKVFNYWKVMRYTAEDLFDGIVIAG